MGYAIYAVVCYAVFLSSFVWAIGFIGDFGVGKTIDAPAGEGGWPAALLDTVLLALFAIQHSVMARWTFKRWWTRFVPPPVERSTYVLAASLLLLLLFTAWRPIAGWAWDLRGTPAGTLLRALYGAGWIVTLLSTFMLSHFELFGLAQAWQHLRERVPATGGELRQVWLYRFVRHPIMVGFLITFWATPAMSFGHLLFSLLATAYILLGVLLEERDLVAAFGEQYLRYRERVPMLLPFFKRRR